MRSALSTPIIAELLFVITLLFFLPFDSALIAQEQSESDPWFDEKREANIDEDEEDSGSMPRRKTNPRVLYNRLMDAHAKVSERNLTERIRTLEEAVSIYPSEKDNSRKLLEQLRSERSKISAAIESASENDKSLVSALMELRPYAGYFIYDLSLLTELLGSPLLERIDQSIRSSGRNSEFEKLVELEEAVRDSGLDRVLGDRFDGASQRVLSAIIENRWDETVGASDALVGEAFLFGRLIGASEKKLKVDFAIPANVDPRLKSNLYRNFERVWGRDFAICSPAERTKADLVLGIDSLNMDTTLEEESKIVGSDIPGKVTEEANPDFMELAKKYEKAAERYKREMEVYEINYENYLVETGNNSEYNKAQNDLKVAVETMRNTPAADREGNITPEFANARQAVQDASVIAISASPTTFPEPQKPVPVHLEILDELEMVPSTIITQGESTPYNYTSKTLQYTIESSSQLTLASPAFQQLERSGEVELKHERVWTKNEDVDPGDGSADAGTFSPQELESALDVFSAEFGSRCSGEFGEMLNQLKPSKQESDLNEILLSLSLSVRKEGVESFELASDELLELAKIARSENSTPKEFRLACLSRILRKSPFADSFTEQQLSELL